MVLRAELVLARAEIVPLYSRARMAIRAELVGLIRWTPLKKPERAGQRPLPLNIQISGCYEGKKREKRGVGCKTISGGYRTARVILESSFGCTMFFFQFCQWQLLDCKNSPSTACSSTEKTVTVTYWHLCGLPVMLVIFSCNGSSTLTVLV